MWDHMISDWYTYINGGHINWHPPVGIRSILFRRVSRNNKFIYGILGAMMFRFLAEGFH